MTKFSPPLLPPLSVARKKTWLIQSADFGSERRAAGRRGGGGWKSGEGRFFGFVPAGTWRCGSSGRTRRRRWRWERGRAGRVEKKFVKLRDRKKEFPS